MKSKLGALLLLLGMLQLFCVLSASCNETHAHPVESSDHNTARATQILEKSLEFYRDSPALSFKLRTDLSIHRNGKTQHKIDSARCELVREKYLRVSMVKPKERGVVAVEGTDARFYCPQWRSFAESKLSNMEQIFADPDFNFVTDGNFGWSLLPQFTSSNPLAEFLKQHSVKSYDGVVSYKGKICHHISVTDLKSGAEQHLWIEKGAKPWIVKFEPASNTEVHGMPVTNDGRPTFLNMTATYSQIKGASKIGAFHLPPGIKKVSHFNVESGDDVRQELVGQPAPGFVIRTANGGKFNLKSERKKIVVMEFWATWCAPCVRALPVLDEVSQNFSNKNVEFIAINFKEPEKKIREFLSDKSLTVRIGIDTSGKVANLYRVTGIPQTVIVGGDGVVKALYVGAGSEVKQQVTKVLQDSASDLAH